MFKYFLVLLAVLLMVLFLPRETCVLSGPVILTEPASRDYNVPQAKPQTEPQAPTPVYAGAPSEPLSPESNVLIFPGVEGVQPSRIVYKTPSIDNVIQAPNRPIGSGIGALGAGGGDTTASSN